jgi:hypothetical protein
MTGFGTLLSVERIPAPAGLGPNPSGSRRNGRAGVRTTSAIQIPSRGGGPCQTHKAPLNQMTSDADD